MEDFRQATTRQVLRPRSLLYGRARHCTAGTRYPLSLFDHSTDSAPQPEDPLSAVDALALRIAKDIDRLDLPVLHARTAPSHLSPLSPPGPISGTDSSEATSSSSSGDEQQQHDESEDRATPRRPARQRTRLPPIPTRRALFSRVDALMAQLHQQPTAKGKRRESVSTPRIVLSGDRAPRERNPAPTPSLQLTIPEDSASRPSSPITLLSPQVPADGSEPPSPVSPTSAAALPDTHAEALMRLMYVFCRANPRWSYGPAFVEIAVPLYLVFCEANIAKAQRAGRARHAEEETYWAFWSLMSEFGDLVSGVPGDVAVTSALRRLGNRVRWADEPLWVVLKERNLDPALPLYTFRWLTTLLAHDRAHLIPIWDFLFAQPPTMADQMAPKLDLLIDMCVALVVMVKNQVVYPPQKTHPQSPKPNLWTGAEDTDIPGDPEDPDEAFVRCLQLFRNYPLDQVGGVWMLLNTTFELNQARRAALVAGEDPDTVAWAEARDAAANRKGWATARLRQAAQGASASTGRFFSSYAQSDTVAQLSKASTNFTANAMARWQAVPPVKAPEMKSPDWKGPDWKGLGSAAGRWFKKKDDDDASISGEEYEFNHSLPSTPGHLESPGRQHKAPTPENNKRFSYPVGLSTSMAARRSRSDSVASTSALSVTSLQDKLSGLASSLTVAPRPTETTPRVTSGPRPLLLSTSARRASNSHIPPSRSRSPTPGLASPPQRDSPLYRIGSRNSMGPRPRSPVPNKRGSMGDSIGSTAAFMAASRSSRNNSMSDSDFRHNDPYTPYESDASTVRSSEGGNGLGRGLALSPIEAETPAMPSLAAAMAQTQSEPAVAEPAPAPEPEEPLELPTPQIAHLTEEDYDHVYEPAEDSFILLDALEADARVIRAAKPALCVEIGSGSGIASTFIGTMLGPASAVMMSTDINPYATDATRRTGDANGVPLNPVLANLLAPLSQRMEGSVDLLIFNPPYVETEEAEMTATQQGRDIGGAWAGGNFGMSVTNLVLERLPTLLAPGGRFYLVAIHQNKPDEIIARMRAEGLECKTVIKRRAGRELLSVIRMVRPAAAPVASGILTPRKTVMPVIEESSVVEPARPTAVAGAENVTSLEPKSPQRSPGRRRKVDGGEADDEGEEDYGSLLDAYGDA